MAHSDFNSTNTYQLLTPEAFEVTKPPDISRELSEALTQIAKLKQENESLQKEKKFQFEKMNFSPIRINKDQFNPIDPVPNLERHPLQPVTYTQPQLYVESLVTHQAAEIAELRQQICQLKADHCIEMKLIEDKHQKEKQECFDQHWTELNSLKYCHHEEMTKLDQNILMKKQFDENKIISLQSELKQKEEMFETEVAMLNEDHHSAMEFLRNQNEQLEKELHLFKTKVADLQQNLDDVRLYSEDQIFRLQQELDLMNIENRDQMKQISQLKTYIGESENIPKPVEVLKTENNALKNKLNICIAEKEHIKSNSELLNIRLSSMTEILGLQEAQLSQDKLLEQNKEKQENALLKRWREKVFALLVQQKSTRILSKNDENSWKQKNLKIQNQLESAENQIKILHHSLSDKQAQLDILNNNNNRLQNDLLVAQQQMNEQNNKTTKDQESVNALKDLTLSFGSKFQEKFQQFEAINKQLSSFGQRISFASSRILFVQNILAKQKYLSKIQQQQQQQQQQQTEIPDKENVEESTSQLFDDLDPVYAKTELVQLQKERDFLAMQLTEILEGMEEKNQEMETKYKEKESRLEEELLETQDAFEAASNKCQSLSLELQEMQKELEEKNNKIEILEIDLSEQKITSNQNLEELEQKHNEALSQQFAEMDRKINDAHRQHMKAEISLRQAERQLEREQRNHTEEKSSMEKDFKHQIMEIHHRLEIVEKERNLMMATLRQEGLIGKLKFDSVSSQQNLSSVVNKTVPMKVSNVGANNSKDNEVPLEKLMEDIKLISCGLLEDSSDESLN